MNRASARGHGHPRVYRQFAEYLAFQLGVGEDHFIARVAKGDRNGTNHVRAGIAFFAAFVLDKLRERM
jgi:hypothetical protein